MSRDFKLLICSLNWTASDTTGHGTGIGTGLSLALGSGDCCDFTAAFLFNGITDFVKDGKDNDILCQILQTVASDIFKHT